MEGSSVYAFSADPREAIAANGAALACPDRPPDLDAKRALTGVAHPRGSRSLSSHLKSRLGMDGIKLALLHELTRDQMQDAAQLAAANKSLPLRLGAPGPIDEARSSAGGVRWSELDDGLVLTARPGAFCASEMPDWRAPTGGHLLTACMASDAGAARGVLAYLACR